MSEEFRRLNRADEGAVLSLVAEIEKSQGLGADFYWPQQELQGELWTTEGWGAFHRGELAAFILYRENTDIWEITVLVTAPHFRRLHLMEKLLRALLDAKNHEGEIWLEVHERNAAAQKLYEKLGFSRVGARPRYYRDGASAYLYSYPAGSR